MPSTLIRHFTRISRKYGRPLPQASDFHYTHDEPSGQGHSTFYKHYAEAVERKAQFRVLQAKRDARRIEHKARISYADHEAERKTAIRQAEDHVADLRLRKLANMAREIDNSSEGKALQAQYNVQRAREDYQQRIAALQQEQAAQIAQARQQLNRATW